jgi:hypothetical protein
MSRLAPPKGEGAATKGLVVSAVLTTASLLLFDLHEGRARALIKTIAASMARYQVCLFMVRQTY